MKTKLSFPVMAMMLTLAIFATGCYKSKPDKTGSAMDDPFVWAFQEKNYELALEIAKYQIAEAPYDGAERLKAATSLTMLNRFEDAVEAFRMAEVLNKSTLMDRTSLYLRATALFNARIYSRAGTTLDILTADFPYSQMTQRGQTLALKIQKRLNEEITDLNLNWYLNKGLSSYNAARPALAAEYLEEYLFLADKAGKHNEKLLARTNFSLGGAYIELGLPEKAIERLKQVSPDYMDYRAGFLSALALRANGNKKSSDELLAKVARHAQDENTRKQALKYLE